MNNNFYAVLPLNLVYEEKYYELSSKAIYKKVGPEMKSKSDVVIGYLIISF